MIGPDATLTTYATGVSGDGAVVVGGVGPTLGGNNSHAFYWAPANGLTTLGPINPGAPSIGAASSGVNADGSVIVGQSESQAFRWTAATGTRGLGFLDATAGYSGATGVSADGSVVVGTSLIGSLQARAFRWTQATGMTNLGLLPNAPPAVSGSNASGVSADGLVVVARRPFPQT